MKVCVTAEGKDLDSRVDPRFGRCMYFIIVDPETLDFESVGNPGLDASGGAGIQAGQVVASKGAKAVITGNVGPNAYQTLQAAGISIFTGAGGTVRQALEDYKNNRLAKAGGPSVGSKAGMGGKR
ncbi:MAG TPA: NifB/NifX family molybdenum-iron cluster-binding protein [Syntrophales bacterium]|nr:NifB/NifX family molybdenum-iron cluster-binding protein [Syntrophales bacterium]HOX93794.1 NifB/NifX family molybdenum-iron cluster-binding protein [Syntrophales bacterium]HPI56134.1 NifB/NifX family molybdenum-iron cluster-binding protein [Syntrophales bacterium]HPN23976.1 NifB/NifX family molybdenum-iron cluster-binding protein [Syntrophales bacterium]HQM28255.1 NifB/NifX family molybdenum-iron cluster-binding protein [Syntrophales bacterium]